MNSILKSVVSRRALMGGALGGMAAAGLTACGAPSGSEEEPEGAAAPDTGGGLDLTKPEDNLYAFGKIWGTYADKPVYSGYQGVQFARIGVNKLTPLFGYVGCGNMQCKMDENGHLWIRGTEAGYFTDLASGEIIDYWDNPYSGERVDAFPFFNYGLRGSLTQEMPRMSMGGAPDDNTLMNAADARMNEEGVIPFILPFQKVHDQYLLAWEYAHEYTNPVTPEGWPKASTGTQDQSLGALRLLYSRSGARGPEQSLGPLPRRFHAHVAVVAVDAHGSDGGPRRRLCLAACTASRSRASSTIFPVWCWSAWNGTSRSCLSRKPAGKPASNRAAPGSCFPRRSPGKSRLRGQALPNSRGPAL